MKKNRYMYQFSSVAQSCTTLCDPIDGSPPGSPIPRLSHPWDSPGKNTGVGCHFLLQGNFPTQGLNPCLLHCRQTLYHLSHKGSPNMLSRLVITFLPRSKCLLISWLQSSSAVILEPKKIKSDIVSPSIAHEVMGPDAMI